MTQSVVFVFFAFFIFSGNTVLAAQEGGSPSKALRSDGRPITLRGTEEALVQQNRLADEAGWQRMESLAVLREHVAKKLFLPVANSMQGYYLDDVRRDLRYLREPAKIFLETIAQAYHAQFRKRLKITSLVETVQSKTAQRRHNPSAAPAYGDKRSLHLTGAAFDVSLKPLKWNERLWMRTLLISYEEAGLIDATEEIFANCFHIVVLPSGK